MHIETLKTQNCQSSPMGKSKAGGVTLPDVGHHHSYSDHSSVHKDRDHRDSRQTARK